MPAAPGPPGGCMLILGVEAKKEEFASERLISIDAEGKGGGDVNTRYTIYKGIPSNGA